MDSRRSAIRRIALYAAAVAIVFGILAATGSLPSADEARDFGNDLGPAAPFLYVPLFVHRQLRDRVDHPGRRGGPPLRHGGRHAARARGRDAGRAGSDGGLEKTRRRAPRQAAPTAHERDRELPHGERRGGGDGVAHHPAAARTALVNYSAGLTHLSYRDMAHRHPHRRGARRSSPTRRSAGASATWTRRRRSSAIALLVILGIAGALFVRFRLAGSRPPREPQGTPPPA